MRASGKLDKSMGQAAIVGRMRLYLKATSGWINVKAREYYYFQMVESRKVTGAMIYLRALESVDKLTSHWFVGLVDF